MLYLWIEKKHGHRRRRHFSSYLYKYGHAFTGYLPPSNRLIYRKLLQLKKICEIFCFCKRLCWQMIKAKLQKENRLLDMTPEGARPATLLKKKLWQRYFPPNFVKFLRTPFSQSTSGRLLLCLFSMKYL